MYRPNRALRTWAMQTVVDHPNGLVTGTSENAEARTTSSTVAPTREVERLTSALTGVTCDFDRERVTGIEPAFSAWEADPRAAPDLNGSAKSQINSLVCLTSSTAHDRPVTLA